MRNRTLKLLITFHSTTGAMAMEQHCKKENLPGRLIPVPTEITAGCGMAWCAPPESLPVLQSAVSGAGLDVQGWYEMLL